MWPILTRLNAVMTTAMTVLAAMTMMLALSTGYFEYCSGMDEPIVILEDPSVLKMWHNPQTRNDEAPTGVSVKVDFRPIWHWNVKQIFLYVTASWETEGKLHEMFLYDHTIREAGEFARGQDRPIFDYKLSAPKGQLRGGNFTLNVKWNVMPHAGIIYFGSSRSSSRKFSIPADFPMQQFRQYVRGG